MQVPAAVKLLLEDGTEMSGRAFGVTGSVKARWCFHAGGEVVFSCGAAFPQWSRLKSGQPRSCGDLVLARRCGGRFGHRPGDRRPQPRAIHGRLGASANP
jgi:hypothetical protein